MKSQMKNHNGFSLLEVLVSMAIFSIGLLALLGLQITAIQANAISTRLTEATYLAQTWISYLQTLKFDSSTPSLAGTTGCDFSFSTTAGLATATPTLDSTCQRANDNNNIRPVFFGTNFLTGGPFQLYWGVRDVFLTNPAGLKPDLKRIGVLVRWQGQTGYWHNLVFITQKCTGWNLLNNVSVICQ